MPARTGLVTFAVATLAVLALAGPSVATAPLSPRATSGASAASVSAPAPTLLVRNTVDELRRCPRHLHRHVRRAAVRRLARACLRHLITVTAPPVASPPGTGTVAGTGTTPGTTTSTSGGSATDYSFMGTNPDGTPARWNPCVPISWRFNPTEAQSTGLHDVQSALADVSAATGLTFTYAGATSDRPFAAGSTHSDGEDLLVGFGTPSEYPDRLSGTTIGLGGYSSSAQTVDGAPGPWEIVQGDVLLRSSLSLTPGAGPGATFVNLVLHEVGHAVGLGHAGATDEIMSPALSPTGPDGFAAGDLAGLARLGSAAACFAAPLR